MDHFYNRMLTATRVMTVCLVLMVIATFPARAQSTHVQGTITDAADGTPIVGANILIKSTTQGTITDADGKFSLEAGANDVLVVSFIGYLTEEIPVGARSMINVPLKVNTTSLAEVVVVGFGEQKKANLSGAVDAIDGKVMEARPIANVGQGLQGAVAGLNVDFVSGEPGGTPNINIRGITSLSASGQPLVLVDNVPMDPKDLNFIAPADIKSISVLKDASSAAIYGARAAYGVILITTKTGTQDGVQINYTNNFSWSKPTILPNKITDPYIYMRLQETSTDNTPWDYVNYTAEQYQWAKERSDDPNSSAPVRLNPNDNTQWQYMGNRDWTKYYLDNPTVSQRQNLSLSGKAGNTSYYLSGSYDSQNGALKLAKDKFDRYAFRGKINFKPYKWLSIGNNTSVAFTDRVKPFYMDLQNLFNLTPTSWDKNPDGTWANNDVGFLGAQLTNGGQTNNKINMLQSTFSGELSFFHRMLRINSDFTVRRDNTDSTSYQRKYDIGFGPGDIRTEGTNTAYRAAAFYSYYVSNTYATFEKTLSRHYFNAIVGYNQEFSNLGTTTMARTGVISTALPTPQLATGIPTVGERIKSWSIRGAFYRLNYIYNDRYIVELDGRYDGSSKFPKDKRFGFFPSASAAWRLDKESFWEPLSGVVNAFKVRGSYGALGNQSGVGEYGYRELMYAGTASYLFDGARPTMISAPAPVSSNYTWEKVYTKNLGVDLGFLQQRISATFDIYRRDTKDMLMPGKTLPGVFGANPPLENAADLKTQGWEMSLAYDDEFSVAAKPLHFNARVILSDNKSYVTRFDNPNKNLTQFYEGQRLGEIWGLKSDGLFKTQEEINNLDQTAIIPWGALNIVPGWPKYQDLDGDHTIQKGTTVNDPKDLSVIGNMLPRYRYGINLGGEWNGFDFRIFFQGVGKMDYYPLQYLYWGFYQQPYAGGYEHLTDFYRGAADSPALMAQHSQSYINAGLAEANTDAKYPVLQAWLADRNLGERVDQSQGLAIPQTRYMLSAAYLRLKNLTIGYSIPRAVLERVHINRLRIYVSGENLTEWSALKKYFDPEAITDNVNKTNPSLQTGSGWGYAYPFQRRYSFGLELSF
jgi:TonB-linked SusC/RagA family outer membrane protein